MNFEELRLSALSKADEEPGDEIIDQVVYDAINHGYRLVATLVDHQLKSTTLEYSEKILLPDDFHSVVYIKHQDIQLSDNDYYISGMYLFITNKDFKHDGYVFDLLYSFYPEPLVEDTDTPVTREVYDYLIVMYGAYNVLLYKKRYNMAEMLFSEFMSMVGDGANES